MSITAADTKLIRRQMADKRASDVIRLMTDFNATDDQQLRNVATAVDLMKLVKRAKPTPLVDQPEVATRVLMLSISAITNLHVADNVSKSLKLRAEGN